MRAARRRGADHRAEEFRIAGDHRSRQPSVADQIGQTVDVLEDRFEQLGALNDPGLERLPLLGVDQQRNVAEQPGTNGAGGILVDAIEHAGVAQMPVGRRKAPVDLGRPELREHPQERPPVRAHAPVAIHHLVEDARRAADIPPGVVSRSATSCEALSRWAMAPSNLSRTPQVERHRVLQRPFFRREC